MIKHFVAPAALLALSACASTGGSNDNLVKACRVYDAVKLAASFIPYPPLQAAAVAIGLYVDPICDGPMGPMMVDADTAQFVLDNTAKLGQLMEQGKAAMAPAEVAGPLVDTHPPMHYHRKHLAHPHVPAKEPAPVVTPAPQPAPPPVSHKQTWREKLHDRYQRAHDWLHHSERAK
jgi:hypothetical protein